MFHLRICHILFIQSLDDGHLDYLHLVGIMNNANMSICVQGFSVKIDFQCSWL